MSAIEKSTQWQIDIANDASHGYSQEYRWGPDYDCSSMNIQSWENAGVPVKSRGATYTGNMYDIYISCGFIDVTSSVNLNTGAGLQRGDVLLNIVSHVAQYIGNGQLVQASINEKGTVRGGQPGDQKQLWGLKGEINICAYYNKPWNVVLRYAGSGAGSYTPSVSKNYLSKGDYGSAVKEMQKMLIAIGYSCGEYGADGSFGADTDSALERFQTDYGLTVDKCYGPNSKAKLTELYNGLTSSNEQLSDKIVLVVDGSWGNKTTLRSQQYLGTVMDGIISEQPYSSAKYLYAADLSGWEFITNGTPDGSTMIRALQGLINETVDGLFGKNSVRSFQIFLKNAGYYTGEIDNYMGPLTVKAWQSYLNDH